MYGISSHEKIMIFVYTEMDMDYFLWAYVKYNV